jgi:peptide/nickel transport system substrate-binding protein
MQKNINLPGGRLLGKTIHSFSQKERNIFSVLFVCLIISATSLLLRVNNTFLVEVPKYGGTIIEGVIGTTPQKINPVETNPFTSPVAENDLVALIYSGLMRQLPNGELIPDLAQSYKVSADALKYTFILKDDLQWHDGKSITSADVKFTIDKVQDSEIKSPHQGNWNNITVETPDEKTVVFTLKQPYAPFIQNTTLGILPKHLWENVYAENLSSNPLNTKPVGSGPYKIKKFRLNGDNTIDYYELEAFDHFALGKPFVEIIQLKFFKNEADLINAYKNGSVTNINSISLDKVKELEKDHTILRGKLPRTFGAFLNQNKTEIFTQIEVRRALDTAVGQQEIIDSVLFGYAYPLLGPIPPGSFGYVQNSEEQLPNAGQRITAAKYILENAGWKKDANGVLTKKIGKKTLPLSFSISTTKEVPELLAVAEMLKVNWEQIGAKVEIKSFETKDNLRNYAIRPRDYEVLLFGEIIGVNSDPYAFWHSSQRLDPGLNISSYANITVDKALTESRATKDTETRTKDYQTFQNEIKKDIPAIFLYAPQFVYATQNSIHGVGLNTLNTPSERFLDAYAWYMNTEHIWKIFAQGKKVL